MCGIRQKIFNLQVARSIQILVSDHLSWLLLFDETKDGIVKPFIAFLVRTTGDNSITAAFWTFDNVKGDLYIKFYVDVSGVEIFLQKLLLKGKLMWCFLMGSCIIIRYWICLSENLSIIWYDIVIFWYKWVKFSFNNICQMFYLGSLWKLCIVHPI